MKISEKEREYEKALKEYYRTLDMFEAGVCSEKSLDDARDNLRIVGDEYKEELLEEE